MKIETFNFSVRTAKREEFIDITDEVLEFVKKSSIDTGWVKIFVPHTTAAITINENADVDVQRDIIKILSTLIPKAHYAHAEGNSDAHAKSTIIGCQLDILIENKVVMLGQWQGIYLCEFDGPRTRRVDLMIVGNA
jgi:secondary thiamine-phosphate synthase enzyme